MATDLGKVGIVPKGTWNSSVTYEVLDLVYYNSYSYIAKQAVPANTVPTNTTYWQPAIDAAIIGNTSIDIPGATTITGAIDKMAFYIAANTDGGGPGLVGSSGFYIVIARHNTDKTAYYIGVVYKASGENPAVTVIASNKITVRAANVGGTLSFNYDGNAMGSDGVAASYRFRGNAII